MYYFHGFSIYATPAGDTSRCHRQLPGLRRSPRPPSGSVLSVASRHPRSLVPFLRFPGGCRAPRTPRSASACKHGCAGPHPLGGGSDFPEASAPPRRGGFRRGHAECEQAQLPLASRLSRPVTWAPVPGRRAWFLVVCPQGHSSGWGRGGRGPGGAWACRRRLCAHTRPVPRAVGLAPPGGATRALSV